MAPSRLAERVRELISQSGLTQGEFATKAGLDPPKMSKSLSGTRRFTSLDLAQIAELGGVTVDWLLGGAPGTPAMAARAAGSPTASANTALREAKRFAELRADLAYLGYKQAVPEFTGSSKRRRWIDQGADLAAQAIDCVCQADRDTSERDLADVIEHVFDIDVAVVGMPDGFDGLAWSDQSTQLIVVGTSKVPARQRFTLAHELGHLLAGDDQTLHLDADLNDSEHRKQPSEKRANAFAASFLMPADTLRNAAGLAWSDETIFAKLAFQLSVSPSTLAWRLYNLKLINWQRRDIFRRMTAAQAAQLAEEMGSFAEWIELASRERVPGGLVRSTLHAYVEGKATLRPFANLIGVDTATLREGIDEPSEEPPLAS